MNFLRLALIICGLIAAAPAVAQSHAQSPRPPSHGDLVGFWTDDGDCTNVIELHADGTFTTAEGGRGTWEIDGGRLTMSGPGGSITVTALLDDPDTVTLVHTDGSTARSTRCPGSDGGFDPARNPAVAI